MYMYTCAQTDQRQYEVGMVTCIIIGSAYCGGIFGLKDCTSCWGEEHSSRKHSTTSSSSLHMHTHTVGKQNMNTYVQTAASMPGVPSLLALTQRGCLSSEAEGRVYNTDVKASVHQICLSQATIARYTIHGQS